MYRKVLKPRGAEHRSAPHRYAFELLIALFLVQPVLGSSEILRPVVEMKISPPIVLSLILILGALPGKISTGFPRPFVLMAHWAPPLPLGAAPCGTYPEMPGWGARFFAYRAIIASRGPASQAGRGA